MSNLSNPIFQDATKARQWLEALLWADGRVCGYCGTVNESTALASREGFYQCNSCRKQFTVMVGTVFERSHIPLNKWLLAAFLLCASKKGISAHQIHRMLGITYKSAWFMLHRLREAMTPSKGEPPLGGEGKTVEADETFIGHRAGVSASTGPSHKIAVLALVERKGRVRTFKIGKPTKKGIQKHLHETVDRKSTLYTDEAPHYLRDTGMKHDTVVHSKGEYVRGDVSTNTVEGVFSIFKRGMIGTYQHCGEQHLDRYLAEFDFRYNNRTALGVNDAVRAERALKGIQGKRLTYRRIGAA
jgi:transposase-like protein